MSNDTERSVASRGSHWPRLVAGFAANIFGLLCVIWPTLPRKWGVGEFVGYMFNASNDPSMGIQYMFYWLMTVPLGAGIAAAGTYFANGSRAAATASALVVGFGGVHLVWQMAVGK
jgi:hypothetical protein